MTGGSGFIGKKLCQFLQEKGHLLTILSRKPETIRSLCGAEVQPIINLDELVIDDYFDAVINLAGAGIVDARWTLSRKKILLNSRLETTQKLINFINRAEHKPEVLISASAVGYYGNHGAEILYETAAPHDEFAHQLCAQWEASANQAKGQGVRVCIIRIGLVIGADGGFLKRMLLSFKLGLGGQLGTGEQWMSWIHRSDLIRIIERLLNSTKLEGVFNAVSPTPVSNAEFTRCLARLLHRPARLPVPATALKLLLGEMAGLLLGGQRVVPSRLQELGFEFLYPSLEQALKEAL